MRWFHLNFNQLGGKFETMIYEDGGTWSSGPTLPAPRLKICPVQIDDGEFVLLGGYHHGDKNSVYHYNFRTYTWTTLPNMPFAA